ncbi:substrate-binding periplasmic protein [Marinobacter sp. X15-166B]|uniref:substrate-binding periplasmic protein n=1 Tax=Marinobacter sp. X15-166B TaxID=1897620 RepID=UPI00085BD9C3|nr:transporter substrate-binding domain-containing protein [Marinobacter sp. X15-166B]OEY66084.1 amino acid ABC transporter substrate-binding protein [Marinobacter sp. X15-166B]
MGFIPPLMLALLALVNTSVAVAAEKLYVYTENYPPFNMSTQGRGFEHSAGNIDGICAERAKAVIEQAGIDYVMKLRNWDYGYTRAQTRVNHGIFCTTYTDDRAPLFKWVGPLAQNEWTIFAPPGSTFKMNRLADAKGKTIGGYRNDVGADYLQARGHTVSLLESDDLNPKRLELGQIDLWLAERLGGPYLASQQDVEGLVPVFSFNSVDLYLAMNPDTPDHLIATLNQALETIRANGLYDAIGTKYGL